MGGFSLIESFVEPQHCNLIYPHTIAPSNQEGGEKLLMHLRSALGSSLANVTTDVVSGSKEANLALLS